MMNQQSQKQTKYTWNTNLGTTQPLTNLWVMLNQLNQKTKSYPNTYLTPNTHLYHHANLYQYCQKIYLDAALMNLSNNQVDFLKSFLGKVKDLSQEYNCDFIKDQYWYEKFNSSKQLTVFQDKKFKLTKAAHFNAPIN